MINEVPFPHLPTILHNGGFDFLIVDAEHGGFDYSALGVILMNARYAGIPAIVRLADNGRKDITKLMDMGAGGLLLPMTDTAADIAQVVRFAKYAPMGKRGISTNRAHTFYNPGDLSQYMAYANQSTMVFAQIETASGVEHVDEILEEERVAGVFLGPNDLSCDYGCIGQEASKAPIFAAIDRVGQAAARRGSLAGIITETQAYLERAAQNQFRLFCCGSEISLWKKGSRSTVTRIQELVTQ